jgi:diaminopimelate epimerase
LRALQFTKMQGLGNDFVVLEGPVALTGSDIAELCDRRFGIGADGVLVVTAGDPIGMEYWNADGSPAEMCGNGLRCVARYAYDKGWARDRNFSVQTPMGVRAVRVLDDGVEVELGATTVTGHTDFEGERLHLIDVGNPHAVLMVDDPSTVDVVTRGRQIGTDARFPSGTNVEFAKVSDGAVTMRVWERGVGETLACGTGMVAAALVASKTHRLEGSIPVDVPGGRGQVEFREGSSWLSGPADYSFRGSVGER